MAWNKALPSVGQTAWGTPLDDVIQEIRDHVDALEAAGGQVAGVTGVSVDGATYLTGQVDLSTGFAPLSHSHAATDITSGTLPIARLIVNSPLVVIKAKGGFGASAGNWPSTRTAVTTDANRCILFIGNSDPGTGLMNDDVDQWIVTS